MLDFKAIEVDTDLSSFEKKVQEFLAENKLDSTTILTIIPLYGQNYLGNKPIAGIGIFFETSAK